MICRNCGNIQLEEPPQGLMIPPKVLYFDIETALMRVTTFRVGRQWISEQHIEQESFVICWGAAWMYKEPLRVLSDCVTGDEALERDDQRCLRKLWELMDRADYIVGHNMRSFDWKTVEARFIEFGWPAPYNTKIMDTLSFSHRRFRVPSHKLGEWSKRLGGDDKDKMERQDWELILNGDEKSLRKMLKYCKGDIRNGVKVTERFVEYVESGGGQPVFK